MKTPPPKMVRALLILALSYLLLSLPLAAGTSTVELLIRERAFEELSGQIPDKAEIEIRLAERSIPEGAFVKEFWIDPGTGQFIANVVSVKGLVHRVWGLALVLVEVPVPSRRLLPDEIILPADITTIKVPFQRVGALTVHDKEELIGQQVRRILSLGRPVPIRSVAPPRIIDRGEKITIRLRQGSLELMAEGRAMGDAHAGQEVRVVNLSSNRALTGLAVGEGLVDVLGSGR